MSEEEKEAIYIVKEIPYKHKDIFMSEDLAIAKVLNIIEKQNKIIKEKDKRINKLNIENQKYFDELNEENNRCMILANNDKFKEQTIDEIAEFIMNKDIKGEFCKDIPDVFCKRYEKCTECIKEYFRKKVEENG